MFKCMHYKYLNTETMKVVISRYGSSLPITIISDYAERSKNEMDVNISSKIKQANE